MQDSNVEWITPRPTRSSLGLGRASPASWKCSATHTVMVRSGKSLALLAGGRRAYRGRHLHHPERPGTYRLGTARARRQSGLLPEPGGAACRARAYIHRAPNDATAEDDPGASPLGLYDLLQDRPLIAIRVLRQHLGMSRPEFAAIFGLDSQIVARWEQGLARPNPNHQALPELIAIVLQTIGCLLGRSDGGDANYLQVDIHQTYNN